MAGSDAHAASKAIAQPIKEALRRMAVQRMAGRGVSLGATSILDSMRMGPHSLLPGDEAMKGMHLHRGAVRRAWHFARPYRGIIIFFLVTILVSALLELIPPFAFRSILDDAIPDRDRSLITVLAIVVVGSAVGDAGLAIVQRWCSARIGEGLIYDLRVALFGKVQRMPVAFFTRTQTGALTSRLNNDVVGAQNAVTSTLGSVVSNVVVLATTVAAMLALEG
jgi:ATP-binding cassette subfamily B protein